MKHKSVLCERWLWCVITITTSAQRNCRAWQNKSIVNPILLNQSKNNCVYVLHEDGTKWTKWNILQNFQGQKYVDTWTLCPCNFLSSKPWALISHYDTPLFWEGFAQDFGTWLQGLAPSHPPACYQGQILMIVWHTVGVPNHPKGVISNQNRGKHFFMDLALCSGVLQERTLPKLLPQN